MAVFLWPAGLLAAPPGCPPAEFVVEGQPLQVGAGRTPAAAVAVFREPAVVTLGHTCVAQDSIVRARRRGTTVRATWRCEGLAKPLRLRGRIAAACTTLTARLAIKGRKPRRFLARRAAPAGERLAGDPAAPLLSVLRDIDHATPHPPSAIGLDADGRAVARRVLEVALAPEATVAQANAVLDALGGGVVSALAGVPLLVVKLPDPGSVAVLEDLVARVGRLAGVRFAHLAYLPQPDLVPPNYSRPFAPAEPPRLDHHLAIRAGAAWNARAAMQAGREPLVVVMDYFGNGVPDHTLNDFTPTADPDFATGNPYDHGYHVLGIMAGRFGGAPTAAGQVTGIYPRTVQLRAVELNQATGTIDVPTGSNRAIQRLAAAGGNAVLNTSLNQCTVNSGATCGNAANAMLEAVAWIQRVRGAGLEGRLFHATSTGNASDSPLAPGGETNSAFSAAAVLANLTDGVQSVPNLLNTLVVDNAAATTVQPFTPLCLNEGSKTGGLVAGIGTEVLSFSDSIGAPVSWSGTSMATPQVAGLAAYLWAIEPGLTAPELATLLRVTARPVGLDTAPECHPALPPAPVVDAYAAVLALDDVVLPEPATAPVRLALLDLDDDGRFDDTDVAAWLAALIDPLTDDVVQPADPDYGRHDLNGDGFTGTNRAERFDLDRVGSAPHGASDHGVAVQTIAGADVPFGEAALTDLDILCYYAHSDLFSTTAGTTTRDRELGLKRCVRVVVDVTLPAQVTAGTAAPVTVRVQAAGNDSALVPLAGVHVALSATGGSLGATTGVTDAQGVVATTATATLGAATLQVTAEARSAPDGTVLDADDAQATVDQPTGSLTFRVEIAEARGQAGYGIRISSQRGKYNVELEDNVFGSPTDTEVPMSASRSGEGQTPDGLAQANVASAASGNVASQAVGDELIVTAVATASANTSFSYADNTSGGVAGGTGQAQLRVKIFASDPAADFGYEIGGTVSSVLDPGQITIPGGGTIDTHTRGYVSTFASTPVADVVSQAAGSRTVAFFASGEGWNGMSVIMTSQAINSTSSLAGPISRGLFAQNSVALTLRLFPLEGSTTTTTSTSTTSTSASISTTTATSSTTTTTLFVPGGGRDPYRVYAATGPDAPTVALVTQLGAETVDLGTVQLYLAPAGVDGAQPAPQTTALTCYDHPGAPFAGTANIVHRFGSQALTLGDPLALCVASEAGAPIDDYVCHVASGNALSEAHDVTDAFQTQSLTLGAPFAFCVPAGVDGGSFVHPLDYLACYQTTPSGAAAGPVAIQTAFHATTITAGAPTGVCVPALALVTPSP
ncbi:MAG: S8/S53 family peptidase [Candidatus Binatia bacterium]